MKPNEHAGESGSTLVCAMCTILILSVIGGNVLLNCTTRYNVTSKQIKGWKDALCAAEAGGDIAYAETRKALKNPTTVFTGPGWSGDQANGPWTYTMPDPIGTIDPATSKGSLTASVTVDRLPASAIVTTSPTPSASPTPGFYRIRSVGTARVSGLRRGGMDDAMTAAGRTNFVAGSKARGYGDSLLRKIDFQFDHFIATYGDGDGNNPHASPVPVDASGNPLAQVSRRIELISVPVLASTGDAIRTSGSFEGPGSSGVIDSYDSKNGAYNKDIAPSSSPYPAFFSDSRDANVAVGGSTFIDQTGNIYGNVTTNGATLKPQLDKYIFGTIDNTVTQTIAPQPRVTPPPSRSYEVDPTPAIIDPPSTVMVDGVAQPPNSWANAPWYHYTYFRNVIVNPVIVGGTARETYINIVVDGANNAVSIKEFLHINRGANVRIYFTGDVDMKVALFKNLNQDGAPLNNIDGTTSTNVSASNHVQFYGVSPPAGVTQRVDLDANGNPGIAAVWYVPGADFEAKGNINMFGAVVCKSFYANGNCFFHFDKQIGLGAQATDYRIASYVEDIR